MALLAFADAAASAKETGSAMPDGDYEPVSIPVSLQPEVKRAERIGLELFDPPKPAATTLVKLVGRSEWLALERLRGEPPRTSSRSTLVLCFDARRRRRRVRRRIAVSLRGS